MTRTTARLGRLAGALVAASLTLAACTGNSDETTEGSTSSAGASASASTGQSADHNDPDVTFAQDMIPHHQSAIEMAEMAQGRASDSRVLDLASRIQAAQQPEIETLTGWLEEWGVAVSGSAPDDDMGGMDHGDRDHGDRDLGSGDDAGGMMSGEDMTALMNASGGDFDRMFLQMMTEHHRGAVTMAGTEIADGQNAEAIAMAENIRDTQNAEIAEMQQLLTELDG